MFTWTGFYVGANVGGAWGNTNFATTPGPTAAAFNGNPFSQSVSNSGVIGGVQAGYNYQMNSIVIGIEADIQGSGLNGSSTLAPTPGVIVGGPIAGSSAVASASLNWFGTVRARLGFAVDRTLIYATGGLIYGGVKASSVTTYTVAPAFTYAGNNSSTNAGWTVGGGVEYAFNSNWSGKLEGLYYNLGSVTYTANPLAANPPFTVGQKASLTGGIVRIGLNYKFGAPASAVVAKY